MKLTCPFCKSQVEDENSAIHGCKKCIAHWRETQNVDHPVD